MRGCGLTQAGSLQNAQLTEQLGMVRVAGTLSKSTEVMKIINDLVRVPALMQTMQSMAKEMMKAGIIDEVRASWISACDGLRQRMQCVCL